MKKQVKLSYCRRGCAMRRIVLITSAFLVFAGIASPAESLAWTRAHELYQRTDYAGSLRELQGASDRDAAVYLLMGQDYYGLTETASHGFAGESRRACSR